MDKKLHDEGLEVRREIMDKERIDNAMKNATDFDRIFQEMVNEYCWGAIWTRPGLSRKTRSLINIAMLSALNRPNEVKLHIEGAINNGCTDEEIKEVLLQVMIYCGVPAALDSVKIAKSILSV